MKKLLCALLVLSFALAGCSERPASASKSSPDDAENPGTSSESPGTGPFFESEDAYWRYVEEERASEKSSQNGLATLSLVIPEGYTLARIGMLLEEKFVCTADEFIAASQNEDFSDFPLVASQAPDTNRCFNLEGYLFPAIYEIYEHESPASIIRRMLGHTEKMIDEGLRTQIKNSGYTTDEILTIASIIEKEAFGNEQMPLISSVLHNRLNIGMRLQCDVTIIYVEGAIKPFITGDMDRYSADYNTYKCAALPAGAICNPGLAAIKAALNPAETDFLFFLTDKDSKYYYSATWEEHQENVKTAGL